ncbi:aminoacyl-tRNA hydrolase [Candidatus Uhrbacteria bacterium]|nr:aminoacyl-tRNA hydrolase [Candidatus Uhrbacteria bacterium]
MKLIVGLGNPGMTYAQTRHNAGWMVLDALANRFHAGWTKDAKRFANIAKINLGEETVILAKPTTFMNKSGVSVKSLLSFYKNIKPNDLLIVHDELDILPGSFKFTPKAGSGGHNGIKSIFELYTDDVARLRIGIGRPSIAGEPVDNWVLGNAQKETIETAKNSAVDALENWITEGLTRTMNRWNTDTHN